MTSESTRSPISTLSIHFLGTLLKRNLRLFLLFSVPVFLAAILYLICAPRLYESTATIQIAEKERHPFRASAQEEGDQDQDLKSDDEMKTIEENLDSIDLFLAVVSRPDIANDPAFKSGYSSDITHSNGQMLASWLQSNTLVNLRHGSRLIDITVYHRDPAMAQKLAKALVEAFTAKNELLESEREKVIRSQLQAQVDATQVDLQKSEIALSIYRHTLEDKSQIDYQETQIQAAMAKYGRYYPELEQDQRLLQEQMKDADESFHSVLAESPSEAAYWAANSAEINNAKPADRIPVELELVQGRADILQKQLDSETALMASITRQMREALINQEAGATQFDLVDEPQLPVRPAKPNKLQYLLLGLAAAFLAGLGAVGVAHLLDPSIHTPMDAESMLASPILGTIPEITPGAHSSHDLREKARRHFYNGNGFSFSSRNGKSSTEEKLVSTAGPSLPVILSQPDGPEAEAFRSLRAMIELLGKPSEHRSLLIVSALPGEGKTTVACNLAAAMGKAGLRTLLVDTDLRQPTVHLKYQIENTTGFYDVILGHSTLSAAVHAEVSDGLDILTAGSRCSNPAELFAGAGFTEVLKSTLAVYDRVIFDSSPVNLVSDALLMARHVDAVCCVVRATTAARRGIQYGLGLLRRTGKVPSGIILNALVPGSERAYLSHAPDESAPYRQVYGASRLS